MNELILATAMAELPMGASLTTFALAIAIIAIMMLGMAVGVIFQGKELKGSCGGTGGQDCYCERNGLPKKCELVEQMANS